MTSKDISFFVNLKQEKDGISMLSAVEEQVINKQTNIECTCGEEMELFFTTKNYPYKVGSEEKVLEILNAPLYKCKKCSKIVEDLLLYADVEKAIENEIFIRLNKRQQIPSKVDFSEFSS